MGSEGFDRSAALFVGESFGPYRVDGEIARGGQGLVMRATHPQTGEAVALKLLTDRSEVGRKRFLQEAQVLRRLDHPSLPQVLDQGESNRVPFIALQLIEGETVEETVRTKGPYDPAAAVEVLGSLVEALDHCHRNGILHRDVKPSNVLIERGTGRPFLVDFGLLQREAGANEKLSIEALSRLSASGELRGTPAYMAPEQASAPGEIDARTDVYGLAATLYFMLTGEQPFTGTTVYNILMKVVNTPPTDPCALNPDLAPGLAKACLWALAKDPGDRPSSVELLQEELELALSSLSEPAPRSGAWVGVVLVSLGVVGAAAVSAGLSGDRGTQPQEAKAAPTTSPAQPTRQSPPATDRPVARPDPALIGTPSWFRALPAAARPHLPLPAGIAFGARPREDVARDGSTLVWVPGGSYPRTRKRPGQPPRRWTALLSGFFLGQHEVTWAQYQRFATRTGARWRPASHPVTPQHPVHNVNWHQADAYCRFWGMSLPSNLQFRHAAGPQGAPYPWGTDEPTPRHANLAGAADGFANSAPVGSFPLGQAPCGAYDLIGNVQEWTLDWVGQEPLPGVVDTVRDPRGPPRPKGRNQAWKAWRGGGFLTPKGKATGRSGPSAGTLLASPATGFRVAVTHPPK